MHRWVVKKKKKKEGRRGTHVTLTGSFTRVFGVPIHTSVIITSLLIFERGRRLPVDSENIRIFSRIISAPLDTFREYFTTPHLEVRIIVHYRRNGREGLFLSIMSSIIKLRPVMRPPVSHFSRIPEMCLIRLPERVSRARNSSEIAVFPGLSSRRSRRVKEGQLEGNTGANCQGR